MIDKGTRRCAWRASSLVQQREQHEEVLFQAKVDLCRRSPRNPPASRSMLSCPLLLPIILLLFLLWRRRGRKRRRWWRRGWWWWLLSASFVRRSPTLPLWPRRPSIKAWRATRPVILTILKYGKFPIAAYRYDPPLSPMEKAGMKKKEALSKNYIYIYCRPLSLPSMPSPNWRDEAEEN